MPARTDWQAVGTKFTIGFALVGMFGSAVVGWINNDHRLTVVEARQTNNIIAINEIKASIRDQRAEINAKLDQILEQTRRRK